MAKFFISIMIMASLVSTLEAQVLGSYLFVPPTPEIKVKAREMIERHGSYILKKPYLPLVCGLSVYETVPTAKFSLQYIGSRKTWIPISGSVQEERFYRIH